MRGNPAGDGEDCIPTSSGKKIQKEPDADVNSPRNIAGTGKTHRNGNTATRSDLFGEGPSYPGEPDWINRFSVCARDRGSSFAGRAAYM
jgi:hypothetical protein